MTTTLIHRIEPLIMSPQLEIINKMFLELSQFTTASTATELRLKSYAKDAVETIEWAIDIIEMYDKDLIRRGDDVNKVKSPVHVAGLHKARTILEYLKQNWKGRDVPDA